uniref:CCHC-type domain-containing protein n=1 Tax=Brassica oleracea var. oleracea TaxID=109376 RepID=A0A0D3AAM8_BRAOL
MAKNINSVSITVLLFVLLAASTGVSVREMTSKFGKLDKFEGVDFRRWQKKMHFLLTNLNVLYVLSMPMPTVPEDAENESLDETRKQLKWENDDYICRGHILNGMSDPLFDVYQNVESAEELWDALELKYMAEDASSKKFLASYGAQYNELLRILGQFAQHNMKMDESISVSSIIDKLPPSWKDFKHMLKHKKEEFSLVQLGSHLRIEESLRAQEGEKPKNNEAGTSSINMMEEGVSSKNKNKRKRSFNNNTYNGSNKKFKSICWNCNKPGHLSRDCRAGKDKNKTGQNRLGKVSWTKVHPLIKDDEVAWWIDSGATTHVCKDREWFTTYEQVQDGSVLHMALQENSGILTDIPTENEILGISRGIFEEFPRIFRGNSKFGFLGISSEYTDGIPRKYQSVGIFLWNTEEKCIPQKKPLNSEEIL